MEHFTIEDVAARAGVSVTTVSHVFSGNRPVRESTSQRVKQIATEMGYRPNAVAVSLRVQRTSTAMIIIPDITNPVFPAFARVVQDVLRTGGYQTLLCNTDADEAEERSFLDEAFSRRMDGVVFLGFRVPTVDLLPFAEAGLAIVNLGFGEPGSTIDNVRFDDRASAAEATSFLLGVAPGSVGFIDGTHESAVAESRLAGYTDAYEKNAIAIPDDFVVNTEFTVEGGRTGMRRLMGLSTPPRAVFCANDLIALGAIEIAREEGLRIPEDVAIMGCDDIDAAEIVTPRLTTIRNSAELIGKASGELLLSRMTGEYTGPGREVVVPHQLVVRESA